MVLSLSLPFNKGNANSAPNAFIRVDSAGSVALIMPRLEVRESIYTSIRMLISDELEVVPNRVEFEYAPKEAFIAYGMVHALTAGNSIAVRGTLKLLGKLSATARAMLIAAAARRWGVDARSCHASEWGGDPPAELAEVEIRRSGRRCGIYADTKGDRAEGRLISVAGASARPEPVAASNNAMCAGAAIAAMKSVRRTANPDCELR